MFGAGVVGLFAFLVMFYVPSQIQQAQDVAAAALVAMLPTFWVASFFA